ncbi:CGNR zinc finger domain-containing protein [Halomonadaceae bacterium KBTZ08]
MADPQLLDFVFHGGRPCLDLFNTVRRRKDPYSQTQDLLAETDGFREWLLKAQRQAGWATLYPPLSTSAAQNPVPAGIQNQAIELRNLIGRFLTRACSADDIETVNQLAQARPCWQLSTDGGALSAQDNLELEGALGVIAEDCAHLFASDLSRNIKECAEERCGIVFLDKSNGAQRHWCSMKECGNRSKASRHYHRH